MRRFFPQQDSISLSIPDRRGTILVWFAVFLFALFPLAALIVDFGLVVLTRRQMQSAANTAALEGLRFRDAVPQEWIDHPPLGLTTACPDEDFTTAEGCDCARRWAASHLVENLFDDDLSPGQDPMQFGAGPMLELTGGTQLEGTDFYASQLMTSPQPPAYKPQLQLNPDNVSEGDMVAGFYDEDSNFHREQDDYSRGDFTADGGSNANSFLIRLRRTNPQRGEPLLIDNTPKVSSSKWTLPTLFGRGGVTRAVDHSDPAALWNQREFGTPVRATAIAQAQPAMAVGIKSTDVSLGLAPFWLLSAEWNEKLGSGQTVSGEALVSLKFVAPKKKEDGYPGVSIVGYPMEVLEPALNPVDSFTENRAIPLYADIGGQSLIVGFGLASIESINGKINSVTSIPHGLASVNATCAWIFPPNLSSENFQSLIQERAKLSTSWLLAPALRRTLQ